LNWTALYIGGFAGGSWVDANFSPLFAAQNRFNTSGFIGGVYIGYDYELPNRFVVGARISAPFGAISSSTPVPFAPGETVQNQFQWAAAVNVIVGYDMGMWMPYLGLGAIYASNRATVTPAGGAGVSDTELHPGVNILAGIKYALTRNWAVGVQYNHSEFASQTYSGGTLGFGFAGTGNFSQNSVVGTLDYRF